MAAELLGGRPDEVSIRCDEASPIERVPLGVPQRLVSGALDAIVPPGFSADYAARAARAGDDAALTLVPGAGHFEVIAPGTEAFAAVAAEIRSLVG
jgi:pimeloyl-ACP methyl ester carboxylesterase